MFWDFHTGDNPDNFIWTKSKPDNEIKKQQKKSKEGKTEVKN